MRTIEVVSNGNVSGTPNLLGEFDAAIKAFRERLALNCCQRQTKAHTVVDVIATIIALALIVIGIALQTVLTASLALIIGGLLLAAFVIAKSVWQKIAYEKALQPDQRTADLLKGVRANTAALLAHGDQLAEQVATQGRQLAERQGLNEEQAEQIGQLGEKAKLLGEKANQFELLYQQMSTSLAAIVGNKEALLKIFDDAREGHGEFFEQCLKMRDLLARNVALHRDNQLLFKQYEEVLGKLEHAIDTVFHHEELHQIHAIAERHEEQFEVFKQLGGQTEITPEQAQSLQGFIGELQAALHDIDVQANAASKARLARAASLREHSPRLLERSSAVVAATDHDDAAARL